MNESSHIMYIYTRVLMYYPSDLYSKALANFLESCILDFEIYICTSFFQFFDVSSTNSALF